MQATRRDEIRHLIVTSNLALLLRHRGHRYSPILRSILSAEEDHQYSDHKEALCTVRLVNEILQNILGTLPVERRLLARQMEELNEE